MTHVSVHKAQKTLNFLSAIIMLFGLGSAMLIYQTAGGESKDIIGYEEGNEAAYPVMPEDSKTYLRNLEVYGGKMNVLATEFRRWFVGLWHGKSLALTVAVLTILISFGCFYAGHRLLPHSRRDPPSEDDLRGIG